MIQNMTLTHLNSGKKIMLPITLRVTCLFVPFYQRHELHGAGGQDGREVGGLAGLQAGHEVPAVCWRSLELGSAENDGSVCLDDGAIV